MTRSTTGYTSLTPSPPSTHQTIYRPDSPLLPHASGLSSSGLLSSSHPHRRNTDHVETIHVNGGTLTFHSADHTSYSYAYGPSGLRGLRFNKYALLCAMFASIGGLEFGYDQGVIANVLVMSDFMARFPLSPFQKGAMTACLELGALAGALFTGMSADRHSRRSSIVLSCIIFLLGSIFQTLSTTLTHLFIGRLLGGFGVGALSMLAPLYISEISPPEVRGSLMALEQFSIVSGVVLGFWIGYFTRTIPGDLSWRIPLGIQVIPGVVLMLGMGLMPASPRLLVLQGRHKEAKEALAKLRGRKLDEDGEFVPNGPGLEQLEMLEMRVEAAIIHRLILESPSNSSSNLNPTSSNTNIRTYRVPSSSSSSTHSSINPNLDTSILSADPSSHLDDSKSSMLKEWKAWKKLWDPKFIARTKIGVLIMVFQQWSGINALLYYSPTLLLSLGFTPSSSTLLVSGGIGIMQLVACVPAILYLDTLGRRVLLRVGSVGMAGGMGGLVLLVWMFGAKWEGHEVAGWVGVGAIYFFTFAYGISFGPIGWVLPSEVFPLSMRSRGVALSTASNWGNNFLVGLLTPTLIAYSPVLTFLLFTVSCIIAYVWATTSVPETANVALEEMDDLFEEMGAGVGVGAGREDGKVRREVSEKLGLTKLIQDIAQEYGSGEGSALPR